MIPITVSFFGGRTEEQRPTQARLVMHGLCYLMGLALTNSILGVVAALTGGLMGALLQSPVVLSAVAAILFFLALFSGQLQRLPRAGGWMLWIRNLMGWVLVGMAAYYIRPILSDDFKVLLPAGIALAAGIHLGWLDKNRAALRVFEWLKTIVGVSCLVLAAYSVTARALQGPGVDWQPYAEPLTEAPAMQGKPVIIDFYADWCTPCRELDEVTFHHPGVVQLSKNQFNMIKVDVTRGGNPLNERLLTQYGVKGVPTVVFLDSEGKERTDLRLLDFLPPEPFLGRMAQVKKIDNR